MRIDLAMNPYLFGTLILLGFWLLTLIIVLWRRTKNNLREFWWGSFVCGALGFTEPLFVPEYWSPPSVLAYGRWDLESFLFCFAIGGIAAVAPEWAPFRRIFQRVDFVIWRITSAVLRAVHRRTFYAEGPSSSTILLTRQEMKREHTLLALVFVASFGFTAQLGLNVIYDAAITCTMDAFYIAWRAPKLRWQVYAGGITFVLVHAVVLQLVKISYPEFYTRYWNLPALSGKWILGAPAEEYLFAATLGIFWAPLYEAWKNERNALEL